jgi:hypothetical protein
VVSLSNIGGADSAPRFGTTLRRRKAKFAIRRPEVIALLGNATTWPIAARGQQRERMRRIGVLIGGLAADDPA